MPTFLKICIIFCWNQHFAFDLTDFLEKLKPKENQNRFSNYFSIFQKLRYLISNKNVGKKWLNFGLVTNIYYRLFYRLSLTYFPSFWRDCKSVCQFSPQIWQNIIKTNGSYWKCCISRFYVRYIGNFIRWCQNIVTHLCSAQGKIPTIGKNVLKWWQLKVIKLGMHSLSRSAVV